MPEKKKGKITCRPRCNSYWYLKQWIIIKKPKIRMICHSENLINIVLCGILTYDRTSYKHEWPCAINFVFLVSFNCASVDGCTDMLNCARFKAVLLKINVFWVLLLCHSVSSSRRFEGTVFLGTPGDTQPHSLTSQDQLAQELLNTWRSFKMSKTTTRHSVTSQKT
jgi:hypothetical protein